MQAIETMHQLNLTRYTLASLLTCVACTFSTAQYGDFGLPQQPADTASVDDIIYYGELHDMSGGYNVNDTVYNFTLYDFGGNPVELYEELAGEKPVVLVSGSVSCVRFRNVFDPNEQGQSAWSTRNFMLEHQDDFNWIFIYGVEAHPTDGNCPSNCPPLVLNDTLIVQPSMYVQRRWAVHDWLESPDHDFPFTMYADNPDNAVYNHFFQRPFGMIGLNCDGTVAIRADWVSAFFSNPDNTSAMMNFLEGYSMCTIGDEVASDLSGAADIGELRVYPNPARTTLTVASNALEATWQLTDMRGRVVANWTQTERLSSFDVADLPRGQYVLIGRLEDETTTHRRVILH